MKFEQFDQDYEAEETRLPDGENEVEIVKAKEWQSKTDGRTALILTLRPVGHDAADVEKWLDPSRKDDHRAAMQLADCLGIPRGQDLCQDNLVGRRLIVKTRRAESRKGERVVYVNQFLAAGGSASETVSAGFNVETATAPPAASSTKRRTPAAKVESAGQGGQTDDIPF